VKGWLPGGFYRVAHYPALALAESDDDQIKGDVFGGISDEPWRVLDEYEGEAYLPEENQGNNGRRGDCECFCLSVHFAYRIIGMDSVRRLESAGPKFSVKNYGLGTLLMVFKICETIW